MNRKDLSIAELDLLCLIEMSMVAHRRDRLRFNKLSLILVPQHAVITVLCLLTHDNQK